MEDGRLNKINWNERLEQYFAETGEKAHCFSWLHKRSEAYYSNLSVIIDLPVIILGTLNGAVSVGSTSLFKDANVSSVAVGAVALLTTILTTIGSYFAWTRRAEGHRIASLNYAKLYRFLNIELSLPQHERMTPDQLLKYVKTEYDRLSEISHIVPSRIIADFRQRFNKPEFKTISFPEETNGLHAISIYNGSSGLPTQQPHSSSQVETTDRNNVAVVAGHNQPHESEAIRDSDTLSA